MPTVTLSSGTEIEYDLDLGNGHYAAFWKAQNDPDGTRRGLVHYHPAGPQGTETGRCAGSIAFDTDDRPENAGRPKWHLESMEPLTVSPSLLCRSCGSHGWIRQGRWVDV
jgi:hypothetical protein